MGCRIVAKIPQDARARFPMTCSPHLSRLSRTVWIAVLLAAFSLACGGGDDPSAVDSEVSTPDPTGGPGPDVPSGSGGGSGVGDTDATGPGPQPGTSEMSRESGEPEGTVRVTFLPGDTPTRLVARLDGLAPDGAARPLDPETVVAEAQGGQVTAVEAGENGSVRVHLEADRVDAGVGLVATVAGMVPVAREALPLHSRDPFWGAAEFVPGVVNTPAWEDSSEISPDGEWLIVSTYAVVDAFSCTLASFGVDAPACNAVIGPYAAPERPDMPGAERIDGQGRISHRVPELCLVGEDGANFPVAMPPTAAYGFRRQADGTFAEPFVIAYGMGGYSVAPFGFSFVGGVEGRQATVVYGHADVREFDDKGLTPNLYVAPITLGEANILGRFTCDFTAGLQYLDGVDERLPLLPHSVHKGNPFLEADRARVWFDDEGSDRSLVYFSVRSGETWSERIPAAAPVNVEDQASYQPYLHGDRLFWASSFNAIRSAVLEAADPADEGAWSAPRADVALAPPTSAPDAAAPGTVVAIGEPSLAVDPDGVTWMYFVAIRRTASGYNSDIARIRQHTP